ncbi:MAG: hypothetical protein QMD04_10660 [Anaerolineales bacterium]|nr:hypothetical protein [Anaerolineales bacterium]
MTDNSARLLDLIISDVESQTEGRPAVWLSKNGAAMLRPTISRVKKRVRWTPEEDRFLQENSAIMSLGDIAKKLGRSRYAVHIRRKKLDAVAPRHAPGYLSCNQIAKILGVDSHKPPTWVDLGILQGEAFPYEFGPIKRRVKINTFKRWLIRPESWVYFKTERIRVPHLRRLVELAQARWGDAWWSTNQAAAYHGVDNKDILRQVKLGKLTGLHAVGLDRVRNPGWAYWFVRRSEVKTLVLYFGKGSGRELIHWSPRADAFIIRARQEGRTYADIARMMKWPQKRVEYRWRHYLKKRGLHV